RELPAGDLPGETMGLEDADHRLVHQGAAVQQDGDVPLAVQLPDDRDHRLRDLLAVLPIGERVFVDSHWIIFRARRRSYDSHAPTGVPRGSLPGRRTGRRTLGDSSGSSRIARRVIGYAC